MNISVLAQDVSQKSLSELDALDLEGEGGKR